MLNRLIDIGEGLRLNALGGVNNEDGTFTGREAARDFIGEVDMARRVHQIQNIGLAVLRGIFEPYGLGLNRNAALFLNIHIIEDLFRHLAV